MQHQLRMKPRFADAKDTTSRITVNIDILVLSFLRNKENALLVYRKKNNEEEHYCHNVIT